MFHCFHNVNNNFESSTSIGSFEKVFVFISCIFPKYRSCKGLYIGDDTKKCVPSSIPELHNLHIRSFLFTFLCRLLRSQFYGHYSDIWLNSYE